MNFYTSPNSLTETWLPAPSSEAKLISLPFPLVHHVGCCTVSHARVFLASLLWAPQGGEHWGLSPAPPHTHQCHPRIPARSAPPLTSLLPLLRSSAPVPLASGLQPTWRVSSSVTITSNITLFRKTPNFWNSVGIYAPTPPSYSLLLFIFSIAPTGLEHALKFSYLLFLLLTGCLCF